MRVDQCAIVTLIPKIFPHSSSDLVSVNTAMLPTKSIVFSTIIVSVFISHAQLYVMQKKGGVYTIEERVDDNMNAEKRPFCNAFTGCGRKRSNLPALTSDGEEIDDSISALLELNAEPAVENLSRQIMSEAKLWEAIQEANMELNRHRQNSQGNLQQKPGIQGAGTCAIPPCYI
ncbi:uncharacterized protein LOC123674733 [Harmonia axyridis]|uniref:uncharacterized protein LOC123674733 n=1 Tax=Harmonia axyridis TaxID=115357 RepID=UPI001E2783E9|nr:uncharacterized protein LOC123674733 [Harmonia axyridis]